MEPAVETMRLSKAYGRSTALHRLCTGVRSGEMS